MVLNFNQRFLRMDNEISRGWDFVLLVILFKPYSRIDSSKGDIRDNVSNQSD